MSNNSPLSAKAQDASIAPMHSCEHIVNQAMIRLFGCGRSVEAHIERKKSKLDYLLPAAPGAEELQRLENEVNRVINLDLPVYMTYISAEEAARSFDLRRLPQGEVPEQVRVVHIGDYDQCLCIGQHVEHTAQIGHFRISSSSYEDGRLRIRFKLVE